jgi:hypothetical protein
MHYEILVEGQTELTALSILMKKILGEHGDPHTWKIHKHQGIGSLPSDLSIKPNITDRTVLHNFPSKLRAYGEAMGDNEVVVLLVDLDDRDDCIAFKQELISVLNTCKRKPNLLVRIAIEELESWFLGDPKAINKAFPGNNQAALAKYVPDSICNTWEVLADVVHDGGINELHNLGKRSRRILEEKRLWAAKIAPHMDIDNNNSPSFRCFRDGIKKLALYSSGN